MIDILEEAREQDRQFAERPIVKFAAEYDIPIGRGTLAISCDVFENTIDPSRELIARHWSEHNSLREAQSDLITTLDTLDTETNVVLFIHHQNLQLKAVSEVVSNLRNHNANVIFGCDNTDHSQDKIVAIVQCK